MSSPKPLGQKGLRAYWQRLRLPDCEADRCLHPGQPIRYDPPRTRLSLDVGHIVPVHLTPHRTRWLPSETRPEHHDCNQRQGAVWGGRITGRRRKLRKAAGLVPAPRTAFTSRW